MKSVKINENSITVKVPIVKVNKTSVTVQKPLIKKLLLLLIAVIGILITRSIYGIKYGKDLLTAGGYIINFGIAVLGAIISYCISELIGSFVNLGKAKVFIYSAFSFLYGLWLFEKAVFKMSTYYDIFDAEGNFLREEYWFWLTLSHTVMTLLIFALTMIISNVVKKKKEKRSVKTETVKKSEAIGA